MTGMLLEDNQVTEMLIDAGNGFQVLGRAYASAEGAGQVQRWFFDIADLRALRDLFPPHNPARWRKCTSGPWKDLHGKLADFKAKAFGLLSQGIYCKSNCLQEEVNAMPQQLSPPPPFLDPTTTLQFQDDTGTSRLDFDNVLAGMVVTHFPSPAEAREWRFLLPSYQTPVLKTVSIGPFKSGQDVATVALGVRKIVTSSVRYYSGTDDLETVGDM